MGIKPGGDKIKKKAIIAIVSVVAIVSIGYMVAAGGNTIGSIHIGDVDEKSVADKAVITADEAKQIAEKSVNGTAKSVEIENEDGYLVYGVIVNTTGHSYDIKVDAGNGNILKTEMNDHEGYESGAEIEEKNEIED